MISTLKKLDKKFLVIFGIIICLPILIIIFLAIIQGCGNRKITHEKYEERMISALESYIKTNKKTPTQEGEKVSVDLEKLVNEGFIDSSEDLLDDMTCEGSVAVQRNGSSVEANDGGFLNYTVNLECENYKTTHLVDKIKENIVTQDSGLYQIDDEFIFKGNKVKNYITFFGQSYRIVSVDKDGILKLIKSESEINTRVWDNKFNVQTNSSSGINTYKDSVIYDYLLNDYSNVKRISLEAKKYIVAHDVCIGKRSNNNYSIDPNTDCSEVLEDQVISLLNVSDYARASLDTNCVDLKSRSCGNYNYMYGLVSSTWTLNASSDNSHEIAYLSGGMMEFLSANTYNNYNIVIYIDGNVLYNSGDGSINDPYVVGE